MKLCATDINTINKIRSFELDLFIDASVHKKLERKGQTAKRKTSTTRIACRGSRLEATPRISPAAKISRTGLLAAMCYISANANRSLP